MSLSNSAVRSATAPSRVAPTDPASASVLPLELEQIYEQHFDFVWRSAMRLGVDAASADDVVQEVFLVVHRRLSRFEGRSSLKTWLFGILRNVVRDYRRSQRRRGRVSSLQELSASNGSPSPLEHVVQNEATALMNALLADLDEKKREVFVLSTKRRS